MDTRADAVDAFDLLRSEAVFVRNDDETDDGSENEMHVVPARLEEFRAALAPGRLEASAAVRRDLQLEAELRGPRRRQGVGGHPREQALGGGGAPAREPPPPLFGVHGP